MQKVRLKLAEVRKNSESPCPFGLPIPFGCQHAGSHVERMAPLNIMGDDTSDEERKMIGDANTKLLAWNLLRSTEESKQCPYAGHILEQKEAVECNYEDSAPGQSPQAPNAPPFYSKVFLDSMQGLYTYPAGYYGDYNVSKNSYVGQFSLQGAYIEALIKKMAEK